MEKKTVRTGIVGAGFAATFHFECLKKVHGTDIEVEGVFATDAEQAKAYAKKRGIRACESLEELIDKATGMRMRVEYEEAEAALREAVERDKHNVEARNELGALLTEMGRQQEAVEILKDARALAPGDEDVLYNMAAAYYRLGKYDESAAALETLAGMSPRSESVLWSLAQAYYKGGHSGKACDAWKRIVALNVPGSSFRDRARRALASVEAPAAR